MASVQFDGGKCHAVEEAKAMMRHACADERTRHKHSNEDIDIARTADNTDLYGLTYERMCKIYDDTIARYRAASTRALRKDAVTMYDLIIPVPQGLQRGDEDDWYRKVAQTINQHYGTQVVLDIKIHRDEIHDYVDPATKQIRTSVTHGHAFVFPEVDGRLNAKKFSSRANMRSLNREIDEMTRREYGIAFLTGEQSKDRGFQTVEQLKMASDAAALELRVEQGREAVAEVKNAEGRRDRLKSEVRALETDKAILSTVDIQNAEFGAKSAFLGDRVSLPRDQYEKLVKTASAGAEARERANKMARAFETDRKTAQKAVEDATRKLEQAKAEADQIRQTAQQSATAILEQAKAEAEAEKKRATRYRREADSLEQAHREYEGLQAVTEQRYRQTQFEKIDSRYWNEYAYQGRLYARLPDGTIKHMEARTWNKTPQGTVYGIVKQEPTIELPTRLIPEIQRLAYGRDMSLDLQKALSAGEQARTYSHHR